jgi:hypothetical protein
LQFGYPINNLQFFLRKITIQKILVQGFNIFPLCIIFLCQDNWRQKYKKYFIYTN